MPEFAVDPLAYLKIVGGKSDNLSYGAEGISLCLEEEKCLSEQAVSTDNVQYLAKVDREIVGMASLRRKYKRMSHRGEFGICVRQTWWGCGVASALTEAILAFAGHCAG